MDLDKTLLQPRANAVGAPAGEPAARLGDGYAGLRQELVGGLLSCHDRQRPCPAALASGGFPR